MACGPVVAPGEEAVSGEEALAEEVEASVVSVEDRLEGAARAEAGDMQNAKRSKDPWTPSWMNSSKN